MHKTITEDAIKQACERKTDEIRSEADILLSEIKDDRQSLEELFSNEVKDAGFSSNAFVRMDQIDLSATPRYLSDGLTIGMLKQPQTGTEFFPAILPFAASNATGFCIDPSCDTTAAELFQMLAFRLSLSIPVELVKCHYVDLHSFGQSAKHFNRLSPKSTSDALICDKRRLGDFISELESIINRLNRNELLESENLREYNADPSHIGVPYHFVFISHIHDRIEKDIISRIYSLCAGRNAATCGIYFFYTVDPEMIQQQQNNPVNDLLGISTRITRDRSGFHFSNSIYGKEFEDRYAFEIEKMPHETLDAMIAEIDRRQENIKPQIVSFDDMLENLISSQAYWTGNTTEGITIPIGRKGANGLVNFQLGGNTADYFAMIGGRPGYGKTVLLHDIICNASIIYSPEELEFYLIDCTNGTGFKPYENLPHARFVSITKQREYTDSAIEHLINEMYRRADLFKESSEATGTAIEKIEKYRQTTGQVLPRIMVIIDEFQVLLEKRDRLTVKIKGSLEKIIREGRKYGISIVFCTQSYRNIDFDTELITLRIAFNLKELDSLKVLGAGNDAAAHLTKKGEAILNNRNGEKEANLTFQAAYTDKVQRYVNFCIDKWEETDIEKPKRFVFDGKAKSDLGSNLNFIESLTEFVLDPHHIITYLGVPMFIRETHSFVSFRKAIGSNLLICGTDLKAALSTMALVNYQISQSIEYVSSSLFITDYFSEASNASRYMRGFAAMSGIPYLQKKELEPVIDQIDDLLKKRIDDDMAGIDNENSPIILTIAYIQSAPDLKKNQYNQASKVGAKIQNILKNGPDYGIHLIVYAYNYKGLSDVLDTSFMSSFGNRIILQGGATGPQFAQESDTLADGTAFLITEDDSTTYEQDPFMLYNSFISDSLSDEVLDYIFSIYKN